jgi:hypothetical protein
MCTLTNVNTDIKSALTRNNLLLTSILKFAFIGSGPQREHKYLCDDFSIVEKPDALVSGAHPNTEQRGVRPTRARPNKSIFTLHTGPVIQLLCVVLMCCYIVAFYVTMYVDDMTLSQRSSADPNVRGRE